jgi:hypothetical protein
LLSLNVKVYFIKYLLIITLFFKSRGNFNSHIVHEKLRPAAVGIGAIRGVTLTTQNRSQILF